ncbi:SDR family oxidoreductase [Frankia sp. CNm7]|uniref:SDR family NAD(P)-dependent oxidoreductase n=1 Tax=Frankia nepalensis TaxID=1836974 RepID=UPI001D2035E4|nr:SDR family oxidoreductase [Frankia nepalensis]MBL7502064.1 SDR family oxidoreductase [Frankia nepalensis]MBL7511970.1 SDR family oxidoreductase [Frankia nepalensis]MBL7524040.1 SDR family oxidoreductase [Frankia nepalensis]
MTGPSLRLDGKVALVTGASRGLGRAIALGFAAAGADVVVSSRTDQACEPVATEIRRQGRRALAVGAHVGDWGDCERLVDRAVGELGRLDVLVNNAGIAPVPPSLAGVTEALFDKTVAVNLKGPLRLTGLAGPRLPPGGSVINISSKASTHPTPHTVVYAAAKAGLNALTVAAAQELGPRGVRVDAIVCGSFHTDSFDRSIPTPELAEQFAARIALGRIATPDEIVGTALFLASDASSYMTGALLTLDGG